MGKRKSQPQKTDAAKRQLMTWNMTDDFRPLVFDDRPVETGAGTSQIKGSCKKNKKFRCADGTLENKIGYSDFYVPVHCWLSGRQQHPYKQSWHSHIASFDLELTALHPSMNPHNGLPISDVFYIYVNLDTDELFLYFETNENAENSEETSTKHVVYFDGKLVSMPTQVLEGLKQKHFYLIMDSFDVEKCLMQVHIYVLSGILSTLNYSAEGFGKLKLINTGLIKLMSHFYEIVVKDYTHCKQIKKHNIEDVLTSVRRMHDSRAEVVPHVNVQHPSLRPSLRAYQKQAVAWMLSKERYAHENDVPTDRLHPLYEEVKTPDGKILYFNKHGGYLTVKKPLWELPPPGGILADEMGLGKTVEILALILLHPRPGNQRPELRPVIHLPALAKKSKRRSKSKREENGIATTEPIPSTSGANSSSIQETKSESRAKAKLTKKSSSVELEDTDSCSSLGQSESSSDKSSQSETSSDKDEKELEDTSKSEAMAHGGKFECICGEHEDLEACQLRPDIVQCEGCTLWQHAHCVHYDLTCPYRGRFLCPHCHVTSAPVPSGATLIITPQSISHQWVDEILKHIRTDSLNVLVYKGVNKEGFMQPQTLANQDLVITTYETLRKELDYVDLPHSGTGVGGRALRRPKRYMAVPSPLVAVQWWRICLDEAQMVEKTTTRTAEMALRLAALNRWCVTGTPIQKGLEDAYGLLLFLGLDPYWVKQWWNKLLLHPFHCGDKDPMLRVLCDVLWRSAKRDVIEEINLPAQTEQVHWLKFSPVEQHFYNSQYRKCDLDAQKQLRSYKDDSIKLSSLDRYALNKLLLPLTKLRQACCHPQAVRGEFLPIAKTFMTMEEVLQQLIKKTQLECEESHRQFVAASNGLAALCIIREEYAQAVEHYRAILRSVVEHEGRVRTDDLQQLHTIHNLHQILLLKPKGISPTMRDAELEQEADEIRTKYRRRAEGLAAGAIEAWLPTQRAVLELQGKLRGGESWWVEVIQVNVRLGRDDQLVAHVKQTLADNTNPNVFSMARKFRDGRGLLFALAQALDALQSQYDALTTSIARLQQVPEQPEIVRQIIDCCLRPAGAVAGTCVFCEVEKMLENYESALFSFKDQAVQGQPQTEDVQAIGGTLTFNTQRKGTWADSETAQCIKAIQSHARSYGGADRALLEYATVHVKLMDALKKEFQPLRKVWMLLKEQVQAHDELDMAITRVRLRLPDEEPSDPPQPGVLEPETLDTQKAVYETERALGTNTLKKKLGHLMYLRNMTDSKACIETGRNPDPCPICTNALGEGWALLRCGHCYCIKCIQLMIERYSVGTGEARLGQQMKCPVCRQKTRHADIAYVNTKRSRDAIEQENKYRVQGDHSTKIQGVVRALLQIQTEEPEAKSLVFSTWASVLSLLGRALEDNHISYRSLSSYKFQENLSEFKQDSSVRVLLLPVNSGSNGLNLIEATHVLLVEPVLNPAQELQAIGRVHRIGQTRPTFVHRFIVRNTIEHRMHGLLQAAETCADTLASDETSFTIEDFRSLFIEDEQSLSDDEGDDVIVTSQENTPDDSVASTSRQGNDATMTSQHNNSTTIDSIPSSSRQENDVIVTSQDNNCNADDSVASTSHENDDVILSSPSIKSNSDDIIASTSIDMTERDNKASTPSGHNTRHNDSGFVSNANVSLHADSSMNPPVDITQIDDNISPMPGPSYGE